MILVKDVLNPEKAEKLRQAFIEAEFKQVHQKTDEYDPEYSCRYQSSIRLANTAMFNDCAKEIGRAFMAVSKAECNKASVRAYKMSEGDYFRTHDDARNGRGFVYYLSKDWQWDWGGILMTQHQGHMIPVIPKFNHLVVVDFCSPHFVTPVMPYAKEARYAVVGFGK